MIFLVSAQYDVKTVETYSIITHAMMHRFEPPAWRWILKILINIMNFVPVSERVAIIPLLGKPVNMNII